MLFLLQSPTAFYQAVPVQRFLEENCHTDGNSKTMTFQGKIYQLPDDYPLLEGDLLPLGGIRPIVKTKIEYDMYLVMENVFSKATPLTFSYWHVSTGKSFVMYFSVAYSTWDNADMFSLVQGYRTG